MRPETAVVMISGHGTIETAVKATKLGAYDFIEKPLSLEKTLLTASRALEHTRLERENRRPAGPASSGARRSWARARSSSTCASRSASRRPPAAGC